MAGEKDVRIEAAEEQAVFGKRREVTGTVRVNKVTGVTQQTIEGMLRSEDVEVRRVPVERWVDGPVPVRQEGDVTIISLIEEVPVVQTRLRVFEEIHLTRTATTRQIRQQVPVRRQDVTVERITTETPDR